MISGSEVHGTIACGSSSTVIIAKGDLVQIAPQYSSERLELGVSAVRVQVDLQMPRGKMEVPRGNSAASSLDLDLPGAESPPLVPEDLSDDTLSTWPLLRAEPTDESSASDDARGSGDAADARMRLRVCKHFAAVATPAALSCEVSVGALSLWLRPD